MGDNGIDDKREDELRGRLRELEREIAEDKERLRKDEEEREKLRRELEHAEHREYKIIVNTREKTVKGDDITYEHVVKLAFPEPPPGKEIVYTVTYRDGPKANPEGTMIAGDTVEVKDDMIFNVTATDKS
jgi:Multiubiquitin